MMTLLDAEEQWRQELQMEREKVRLLVSPVKTIRVFTQVLIKYAFQLLHFAKYQRKTMAIILSAFALLAFIDFLPGPQNDVIEPTKEIILLSLWWLFLGILSSVGLGTGLHTFVLYLGPLAAKASIAATECDSVDFAKYGPESFLCPPDETPLTDDVGFWDVLYFVQLETIMWGIGTAIGELPPYFVARAARLSGGRAEELDDMDGDGLMDRVKRHLFGYFKKMGFLGILLFASVPNPLYDLAGLTCGHFLVPFHVFFGATLLGKAFIKAHLQTSIVILFFDKHRIERIINAVESALPFLQGSIRAFVENEQAKLHRHDGVAVETSKGLLGIAWDVVLICMVLYFLISIVDSSVQTHLAERDEETVAKGKKAI